MAIGDKIVVASKATVDQEITKVKDEAQAKQMLIDDIKFNGYGYTKRVPKKDRWLETDVSNTIVDKVLDPVRFSDGLVDRTDGNVVLPAAPFAPNTTDELLDYSVNGVETQVDHKVGDIVHCGNGEELITDSNLEGSLTPNDETIAFDGTTYVGIKYSIEVEVSGATAGVASLAGTTISTNGRYNIISTEIIELIADADYDGTVVVNTIKMIEQTYQCTTDAPAGTLVTSSEFQSIDYVTRTDVILLAKDGYKTFKGTKYFGPQASNKEIAEAYGLSWNKGLCEVSSLEVVNSSGELEVISGEVIVSGLVPRLSATAYHPVFGAMSSARIDNDTKDTQYLWYQDGAFDCNGTYDSIDYTTRGSGKGTIASGLSGRPDSRFYDKIYFDGLGGIRSKLPYAIKPNLTDLLKEQEQLLISVDDDAEQSGVELTTLPTAPYKTQLEYLEDGTIRYNNQLVTAGTSTSIDMIGDPARFTSGDTIDALQSDSTDTGTELRNNVLSWNVDQSKMYRCVNMYDINDATSSDHTTDSTSTDLVTGDLVWNIGNSTMYKFVADDETGVDLSAETYPTTDRWDVAYRDNTDLTAEDYSNTNKWEYVIGRYPNSWMNYLAMGKSLPFNPLLVTDKSIGMTPPPSAGTDVNYMSYNIKLSNKYTYVHSFIGKNDRSGNPMHELTAVSYTDVKNSYGSVYCTDQINNKVNIKIEGTSIGKNSLCCMMYTSYNQPLQQSDTKPILQVSDRVLATNSHSVHQGGMLTNCVTGKVATGA